MKTFKTNKSYAFGAFAIFIIWSLNAHALTINAASCATGHVQTAINSANDGDKILIPAGNCTWTNGVSWDNKNISVIGAGIGNTNITLSGGGFSVSATSKSAFRISGMTLNGAPTASEIIYIDTGNTETPLKGWRVDHVRFNFSNQGGLRAIMIAGITYGLIDHCAFDGQSYIGIHTKASTQAEWDRGELSGSKSWSYPLNLGSDEAIYVEDSTWNLSSPNETFVNDMSFGARMVFRHNIVNSSAFQSHSARGRDRGGAVKYEIYNNIWKGNGHYRVGQIRSGTGVIFNNYISEYENANFDLDDQRASTETGCFVIDSPSNRCNGSNSYDGNLESNGWPCMDQIGRGAGAPKNQPSVPLYAWNNGSTVACASGESCNNSSALTINSACPSASKWIKTTGTNHANGIVDYINNGSSPKPGYTPYTYPHPLQAMDGTGGSGGNSAPTLSPPSNLKVIP